MGKRTILFLAANPVGTDPLALDEEARAIQVELERSGHRDRFDLVTRWAARPLDLLHELRKLKPSVVHFSGHGGRLVPTERGHRRASARDAVNDSEEDAHDGLYFQDRDGQPQRVSAEALQRTLGAAGSSVRVVVLNACYSSALADGLRAHVDCVVGMRSAIDDHAARSFAIGFYGGLGEGESVATAFEQGRAAISLEGLHDSDRPQLRLRAGVDADRLVLTGGSTSPPDHPIRIRPQVDIGILTIRDDEFRAVLAELSAVGRYRGPRCEYALRRADAGGGEDYTVAVIRQAEQGNGEAQDAARDLIEDLAPRLLIVVGIAGGLPSNDLTLGDVVIATRIHDFTVEARKAQEPTEYAASGGPITRELAAQVANLAAREAELGAWAADLPEPPLVRWTKKQLYGPASWQDKLQSALQHHHGKGMPRRRPRYIDGVIASSDRLVKDPELLFPWITTARNILAVEMESAGVYRAARERCPMLAIRGISDIVGLKRAEAWIAYACRSAAAFTRAFLRTRPVPLDRGERSFDATQPADPGPPHQPRPAGNPVGPGTRPRSPAASEPSVSMTTPTATAPAVAMASMRTASPAMHPETQRAAEPAAGRDYASSGAHGARGRDDDHIDVHDRLLQAGDALFERILMYAQVDRSLFPPQTAELAVRVIAVARLANVTPSLCVRLVALLDEHAPWTRNKTSLPRLDARGGRQTVTPASGAGPGLPGAQRETRVEITSGTAADQLPGNGNVAPGTVSVPACPPQASETTGAASSATKTQPEVQSPEMSVPKGARPEEADERLAGMKRDVTAVLTAHPRLIQPLADRLGCRRAPDVIADEIFERKGSDVVALLLGVWDAQSLLSDGDTDCQAADTILCIVLPYVPDWRDEVEQVRAGKEEIVLPYSSATIAEAVMAGGTGRHCRFEQKDGAPPYGKWAVELPSDAQTATFTSADHVRDSIVELLDRQLRVGGASPAARRVRVQSALQIQRNLRGPHREQRYLLFRDAEHPEFLYGLVRTALRGETGLPGLVLVRLRGTGEDADEAGIEHSVRLMLQLRNPR